MAIDHIVRAALRHRGNRKQSSAMPPYAPREQRHDGPPGEVPPMSAKDVTAIEALLGYCFIDKSLVELALTHGSFYWPNRPGDTYERLEYLGDGVLTCLMSREVFRTYRTLQPGPLTRLRAANVDTEKLARVAVHRGLHRFLRHKAPKLQDQKKCANIQFTQMDYWILLKFCVTLWNLLLVPYTWTPTSTKRRFGGSFEHWLIHLLA
uniref:RNase III domain-containing protein n=1 Tax=Zea mays TaxID=4577 RepID=C0HGK1_MAIZE|nr:unknown [Zea mays]